MTTEPTYNFNADGSINIPVNGTPTKYVKESDLLAVKGSSESKVREWEGKESQLNANLAEANRLREESHNQLLQERAAKEQLQGKYNDYDTIKTKVGELETELNTSKEAVGKHETELAGRIRTGLVATYNVAEDTLKDKDLSQLRNLEDAAKLIGPGKAEVKKPNYDGGAGGPGGGSAPETPTDRANRILEEHDAKRGKPPAKVSSEAVK